MPEVALRRSVLTKMSLAAKKQVKELGMLGLAGGLLVKSLQKDDE
jgi:hypothetical protein